MPGPSESLPPETDLRAVTPTICRLADIEPPMAASAPMMESVIAAARERLEGRPVDRVLVYAPDAIGRVFLEARPELLKRLSAASDVVVPLRAMFPPKTPVCFASMFSGALPEVRGIRKYERPVLACDTLFDALARAGRRTAIVAVRGSSMDIIFRNRAIDYFTEESDSHVAGRALELLQRDEHEFIVALSPGVRRRATRGPARQPGSTRGRRVATSRRSWRCARRPKNTGRTTTVRSCSHRTTARTLTRRKAGATTAMIPQRTWNCSTSGGLAGPGPRTDIEPRRRREGRVMVRKTSMPAPCGWRSMSSRLLDSAFSVTLWFVPFRF